MRSCAGPTGQPTRQLRATSTAVSAVADPEYDAPTVVGLVLVAAVGTVVAVGPVGALDVEDEAVLFVVLRGAVVTAKELAVSAVACCEAPQAPSTAAAKASRSAVEAIVGGRPGTLSTLSTCATGRSRPG